MIRENYGKFLTDKRIEQELTLKQLSEKSGVSVERLTHIEKENKKRFSIHDFMRHLKALDVALSEVIYD